MIEFDFSYLINANSRSGSIKQLIISRGEAIKESIRKISSKGDWLGWVNLPTNKTISQEINRFVSSIPEKITHCVLIGIGGSCLGAKALYTCAYHPFYLLDKWQPTRARMLFLDNSDPETTRSVIENINFNETLFVVITKSGHTAETISQFMIIYEKAKKLLGESAKDHFVIITDPEKGTLRKISRRMNIKSFSIPPDVGGRFSFLSAAGLVPCAISGIKPEKLLSAAQKMMNKCLSEDIFENPSAILGAGSSLLYTMMKKTNHVLLCYSDRLVDFGAWFVQLWAESLGKKTPDGTPIGPTPINARGATDQHSILQLLKQGPRDKFVIFIDIKQRQDIKIPDIFTEYESFNYLSGHSLGELISCERAATHRSLLNEQTPSVTITLDELNPSTLAALMYFFEVSTALAGFALDVNPFDQPGVEESKRFSFALLGRKGYESLKEKLKTAESKNKNCLKIRI